MSFRFKAHQLDLPCSNDLSSEDWRGYLVDLEIVGGQDFRIVCLLSSREEVGDGLLILIVERHPHLSTSNGSFCSSSHTFTARLAADFPDLSFLFVMQMKARLSQFSASLSSMYWRS